VVSKERTSLHLAYTSLVLALRTCAWARTAESASGL
jgi:hypothetical protein